MPRLVIVILMLLAGAGAATAETPVERHGRLQVQGNRIVNEHGEPVALHGMSLFWSQWMPQFYNAATVQWLRDDWNVSVVRAAVAVAHDGYLSHPELETAKADAVIEAAIAAGVYVIVDWHSHEPEPEAAARFFGHVAAKYGDRPNVIYETYNEPLNIHGWAEVVKPYHLAVIPHIRMHDPDNLIIAGTPTWSQDVDIAAADPLPFSNVAYTLHFYAGTHRQELRDRAELAMARGAALFITEWGATPATGDGPMDVEETRRWWDFIAAHGLSDLNWSITDKDETSAALRPGASGQGGWGDEMLTPSGRMVRERLRGLDGDD